MQTKLLRLIEKNFSDLRKSEKKVASFAMEHSNELSQLKMAEAAEAIGVSEPSINRF